MTTTAERDTTSPPILATIFGREHAIDRADLSNAAGIVALASATDGIAPHEVDLLLAVSVILRDLAEVTE